MKQPTYSPIASSICVRVRQTLSVMSWVLRPSTKPSAIERFDRAGRLTSYVGLVASENSSGETCRHGAIAKTGAPRSRRLLLEAVWGSA